MPQAQRGTFTVVDRKNIYSELLLVSDHKLPILDIDPGILA
jgi:hypothetical protein